MKIVLVTGGAGFIGSHLIDLLAPKSIKVKIYDNLSSGSLQNIQSKHKNIEISNFDILDYETLLSHCKNVDVIFHLAALTSVSQSVNNPLLTHEVDVTGTINVLWAAVQAQVPRVVLSSSCSVYGDSQALPIPETTILNPLSPYAASKLSLEAFAQSFYHSYGLSTICLRYFNVYGTRQSATSDYAAVIPKFINCYKSKSRPIIYGDGTQTRDFIHVRDVARANLQAALLPEDRLTQHRIFNIGTGQQTSLLQLLQIVAQNLGYTIEPTFYAARPGDIKHSCSNSNLARTILEFQASINIQEGIQDLIL